MSDVCGSVRCENAILIAASLRADGRTEPVWERDACNPGGPTYWSRCATALSSGRGGAGVSPPRPVRGEHATSARRLTIEATINL